MVLMASTGESMFQLLVVLFCFVIILIMTYYTTRWIAGYQKTQSVNKNLAVVETLKINVDKYIQLIQAGKDRYYIISISKNDIRLIGELTADELKEIPTDIRGDIPTIKGDFSSILDRLKKQKMDK